MGKLRMTSGTTGSGFRRLPEGDVVRLGVGDAREEQCRIANGEVFEVLDVMREGPCVAVLDEGEHELHHLAQAAAVGSGEAPEVVIFCGQALCDAAEHVHIEEGVAVGFGSRQFQRETAVGSDLVGDQGGAEAVAAPRPSLRRCR